MKQRLDKELLARVLVASRSQAEDFVQRGFVMVNGQKATKPAMIVDSTTKITLKPHASFVSRAGEKLYSVLVPLKLDFKGKTVLDVGSSTGGFTEVALKQGASRVIAVDVGTDQLSARLHGDARIDLHEKTDIRNFIPDVVPDLIVIDVSFISLRAILPHIATLSGKNTQIVAMCKPQFEAGEKQKNKGVIKNDAIRRQILKDFEAWLRLNKFVVQGKCNSGVSGTKGNLERFYLLRLTK